jgi:hypothetical protein
MERAHRERTTIGCCAHFASKDNLPGGTGTLSGICFQWISNHTRLKHLAKTNKSIVAQFSA